MLLTTDDTGHYPRVPATTACELDFITQADRDVLVLAAEWHNRAEIKSTLSRVRERALRNRGLDVDALEAAADDPEHFARLARKLRLQCHLTKPTWTWQIDSIVQALTGGATPEQCRWLAGAMRRIRRYGLERDMEQAWHRAFWLGDPSFTDEM